MVSQSGAFSGSSIIALLLLLLLLLLLFVPLLCPCIFVQEAEWWRMGHGVLFCLWGRPPRIWISMTNCVVYIILENCNRGFLCGVLMYLLYKSSHNGSNDVRVHYKELNWITQLGYTGCPSRNVPDFGRVFLMLKYTDITQNTYVQSWTVTEIMAREKCGLLAGPRTVPVSWQSYPCLPLSVESYNSSSAHARLYRNAR